MNKLKFIWIISLLLIAFIACKEGEIQEEQPLTVVPKPDENLTKLPDWVEAVPNPHKEWVAVFPGEISREERRIEDTTIIFEPYFKKPTPNISTNPTPFFSTGLYAPAAEVITITVPEGLSGVGYRIGVWPCDLDRPCVGGNAVENQRRYHKVFSTGSLATGENKIYNYFGGHIYLTFPQEVQGQYSFRFKGGVKSPDFIDGDNPQEWLEMIKNTSVPFAELRGNRFICTYPLERLQIVTDPQRLIKFYDDFIFYCYDELFGFSQSPDAPDNMRAVLTPWRVCLDMQQCGGAAHSGYPFVAGWNTDLRWVQHEELEAGNMWGLWHEIGHNFQNSKWRWSSVVEVTCNLNIFSWYCRFLGHWATGSRLDEFKVTVENYVINTPNEGKNNTNDLALGPYITPFVQLAYGLDWGVYKYLGIQNRTSSESTSNDQSKIDFFAKRVCEYANANLLPFFDDWGFVITKEARCYMSKFPAWDSTPRGIEKGEFWRHFNYEPVTDPSIVDIYIEPDPSNFPDPTYDCGPQIITREDWTVMGFHPRQYGTSYKPENLLDDNFSTIFATAAISGMSSWPGYVVFDMSKEYWVGGAFFSQRSGSSANGSRPGKIKVYVSTQAPIDSEGAFDADFTGWILVLETTVASTGAVYQYFELDDESKWIKGRYIKCEVSDPYASNDNPAWAEFGIMGRSID